MPDIFSPRKRSEIMKKIGSKNSTQELFIRKLVYILGYRYRLHVQKLPGKPDLVFSKHKRVIFVNGCFWHGHNKCSRSNLPETNRRFWEEKIAKNKERDKRVYRKLKRLGWEKLIIWQCQIKKKKEERLKERINKFLKR